MAVDGDLETSSTEDTDSFPVCPHCGAELVATSVSEPTSGTAVPYACPVVSPALEFE